MKISRNLRYDLIFESVFLFVEKQLNIDKKDFILTLWY
jgi:hypothetical protein